MNFYKCILIFILLILSFMSVGFAAEINDSGINTPMNNYQDKNSSLIKEVNNYNHEYGVYSSNSSSKILKEDSVEDSVEYVNITEKNYKEYFSVFSDEMFVGKKITKMNTSLILNFQYFPSNIEVLSIDECSNNFVNKTLTLTSDKGIFLNNTELVLGSNFKVLTIENINITYDDNYRDNSFVLVENSVQNCVLRNISVDMDINGVSSGYLVELNGPTLIENSYIKGRFMETIIDWLEGPKTPDAYGFRIYSRNCILRNNTIDIISSGNAGGTYYSMYGIYVMSSNNTLTNNTIILRNCTGYAYGVVVRSSNNTISGNNITVSSVTYANAVILEMVMFQNNTISDNYVNVTASYGNAPWGNAAVAYGLLMLDFNYNGGAYSSTGRHPLNNSFVNNTIVGSAGQIYGIEIYGTGNTNLSGNNINITGRTPMGIGAIGSNITITNNNIINNGEHNESEGTADYLEAVNTGLYTFYSSTDMHMINNTITSINGRGILIKNSANVIVKENVINVTDYDYAVEITRNKDQKIENNMVINNTLITTKHTGDRAVSASKNNTIQNNIPVEIVEYVLKIDTTEFTLGTNASITASIYYGDELDSTINKGKVSFKVNGKTLKYANGKVIYAKLVNGTATINNYTIPDTWNENTTIQAVYSGSTELSKLSSEKTNITITQQETNNTTVTLTTEDIETTTGSTVVLKASITNGSKLINTGKVVFKINGKTLKDANGKVIYAKVVNGTVSVEYVLPESMMSGSYNLSAVFIANGYDRLEDTKTLLVN